MKKISVLLLLLFAACFLFANEEELLDIEGFTHLQVVAHYPEPDMQIGRIVDVDVTRTSYSVTTKYEIEELGELEDQFLLENGRHRLAVYKGDDVLMTMNIRLDGKARVLEVTCPRYTRGQALAAEIVGGVVGGIGLYMLVLGGIAGPEELMYAGAGAAAGGIAVLGGGLHMELNNDWEYELFYKDDYESE